ncbi:MAG TPA: lipopolysaccharide biosynthesis protein [Ruminococcus sp.]|nr:lipopolysaccharide biosynthesis protein [Ruminococcus sp.]
MADFVKNEKNVNVILKNDDRRDDDVTISFPAVFRKLKKHFAAWFLTSVIVGGFITGLSMFFSTTTATPVRALVSFTYKGIENGKNPDGTDFDVNTVKSPNVIEKAIGDCGFEPELLETVRKDILIEGLIPEDTVERITAYKNIYENAQTGQLAAAQAMLAETWYSTQYTITFDYKDSGLNRSDAVQLLNTILDCYRDYFFERFGYNEALGSALATLDYTDYDYAEAVDMFRTTLGTLKRYVNSLSSDDTTRFRSTATGYTFADLKSAISSVQDLDLDLISSYLNVYNITKDKDRLQAYYEYRIENLERQKKTDEETLRTIQESFDAYEKDQIIIFSDTTTNTESSIASEEYDKLINRKIAAQNSLSETDQSIEYYKQRLTALKRAVVGSTDKVEKIEVDLASLNEKVNDLIQLVNDTADDYYQNVSLANAYNVLVPATSEVAATVKSGISRAILPVFGIELLLMMSYLTVAFVQALKEEARRKKNLAEVEAALSGAEPLPEQPDEEPKQEKTEPEKNNKKK